MRYTDTLSSTTFFRPALAGFMTLLAASPAYAHHAMGGQTPQTFMQGFISGLAHPVIGLDHFAFLVVAALLAFAMKGASRYLLPLAFVGATVGGTAVHLTEANLPLSEMIVALSVIIGAVLTLVKRDASALLLGALFASAGLFHGYAYGESIVGAENTPLLAYLAGFSVIQYSLIVGGILGLDKLASKSTALQAMVSRIGGSLALLTGGLFLLSNLG